MRANLHNPIILPAFIKIPAADSRSNSVVRRQSGQVCCLLCRRNSEKSRPIPLLFSFPCLITIPRLFLTPRVGWISSVTNQ